MCSRLPQRHSVYRRRSTGSQTGYPVRSEFKVPGTKDLLPPPDTFDAAVHVMLRFRFNHQSPRADPQATRPVFDVPRRGYVEDGYRNRPEPAVREYQIEYEPAMTRRSTVAHVLRVLPRGRTCDARLDAPCVGRSACSDASVMSGSRSCDRAAGNTADKADHLDGEPSHHRCLESDTTGLQSDIGTPSARHHNIEGQGAQ